ncbi:DNA-directed RNA polymerase subunit alpha [bacterium BMS3Abin05]|nr:DNA-directed RNA polymerase subunit alpha [bacterium BMS3Abin05]GBE28642.1 DNA-directed RNA polymerase subunit alpha [bacterium BMS3Bbin03]HDZ11727.1 DNA-directed RNA polymerase subunit alpha [Bacteroidota bacterium]
MNFQSLQMPERIELDEATFSNNYGKFIVQPLERGFGVTIGNALRRVLLSSLPGAAITSIKIDGVLHEFTTIPGVVEDVSEIIMNLKAIRFKLIAKKPEKVSLHLKGPMEFNAGELQKDTTDFEVLNPDYHIATLNEDADFNMEVRISRGRGYVPAENNKHPDQPIGVVPIDAIFTPIINVTYHVEETRVGQRTDFEKLILEIQTDGSLTPDDALTQAARTIHDYIQLFINYDVETEEEIPPEIDEEALRIKKLLKMSVDELELSVRAGNCLKAANIETIADLVKRDESEMLKFRNFGRKSLTELSNVLESLGLYFGLDVDKYLNNENE